VKTFDGSGKLKSEVAGIELRHFPDSDTVEIDKVRIRSFDVRGRLTTATADRALSNADGSEVQLLGNAEVVREEVTDADGQTLPRLEFRGDFLHAFLNDERVKSHLPVTLIRGHDHFSGDSLFYDNLARTAQLQGRVKGLLMPRK
jgi:lipopolysaccharide export system protein LptC